MRTIAYTKGLHEVGDGLFAYLQPDGGWGWSNAGLICGEEGSLLVDTLFDLPLTEQMLEQMRPITATAPIARAVNTHGDGDHWFGNAALPAGTEIHATERALEHMKEMTPQMLEAALSGDLGPDLNAFAERIFGPFEFGGEARFADETFTGRLELELEGRTIELIELGPAHSVGDAIIHVPGASTVFTGDLLFIDGTPMVKSDLGAWIEACERIIELDARTLVPGHGPVTDNDGVREVQGYLEYVREEAGKRFAAGMDVGEAIDDIDVSDFADWSGVERIVPNVHAAYNELDPDRERKPELALFAEMAGYVRRHGV